MHTRMFLMIAGALIVGGCAAQRQAQDLNQLRSEVGVLDQRVGQLERTSLRQSSSSEWTPESQTPSVATPVPGLTPSTPGASSTTPSIKPTTRDIQRALKNAGFYQGPLDGKMGPLTKEAVREFQRVNGLKIDGVVGKQTWSTLQPYADLSAGSGELSAAETLK